MSSQWAHSAVIIEPLAIRVEHNAITWWKNQDDEDDNIFLFVILIKLQKY